MQDIIIICSNHSGSRNLIDIIKIIEDPPTRGPMYFWK